MLLEIPVSVCCLAGAARESARSPVQVACQPSAAPRVFPELPSQSGSIEHTGVPKLLEMLGGACSPLTVSVCCLKGVGPRSAHSPVQAARQLPAARALPELLVSVWI